MKQKPIFLLVATLLALLLILNACASGNTQEAKSPSHAHWSYAGEEGPAHWGELDPAYEMCGIGKNQSPINISSTNEQDLANIAFHYHTPSEHEVEGKLFAGELHIVHQSVDGKLAVVGLFIQEGAANAAYDPFISNLPAQETEVKDMGVKINAMDLLPSIQTTYRYSGSLTTPPCSEDVSWMVMTTPVELSSDQLSNLESLFEANNRPVQPLNDRSLSEDNTP